MIEVQDRVQLRLAPSEAFAFLADFTHLPEWDPGIARAARGEPGPLTVGATFNVVARFAGREVPMVYTVEALDAEQCKATLVGRADGIVATDFIHVYAQGAGSEVHWRAEFQFLGARRLFEPFSRPLFSRLAKKAMTGLRQHLGVPR